MAIKLNFDKIIEKAKRTYNEQQKNYIISSIELARKYILDFVARNPNKDLNELKNDILNELYENSYEFAEISNLKNDVFQYEIIDLFIKNPKELEEYYNKMKNSVKKSDGAKFFIDRTFEERKEDFIRQIILLVEEFHDKNGELIDIIQRYSRGDKDATDKINESRKKLSRVKREKVDEQIKNIAEGDLSIIKMILPENKRKVEELLKQTYIKILNFIGDFFEKNDLLDKYIQRNNSQLSSIGLSRLSIDKDKFKEKSILNKEFLEQLDFYELPVMTAFWLNRYTKEIQSLNNGIFAINTLGLWEDIISGKTKLGINDEQYKAIYCKTEFLKIAEQAITESTNEKIHNNSAYIIEKTDDVATIDVRKELDEIEEIVRVRYHDEFEGILPNSYTQIMEDLNIYMPLASNIINGYSHKDEILATQILSYIKSKRIKNWGYIKENKSQKDNMLLIGIDYEGYNMPVKLHMHKERVIQILREAELDPIIPFYEGNEDFKISGNMLKNHIIMKLTKEQEHEIIRLATDTSNKRTTQMINFIEHLNFLRSADKYPKHLAKPIVKKGNVVFARPLRKYINLETNEIWIKEATGSLKKEDLECEERV